MTKEKDLIGKVMENIRIDNKEEVNLNYCFYRRHVAENWFKIDKQLLEKTKEHYLVYFFEKGEIPLFLE